MKLYLRVFHCWEIMKIGSIRTVKIKMYNRVGMALGSRKLLSNIKRNLIFFSTLDLK